MLALVEAVDFLAFLNGTDMAFLLVPLPAGPLVPVLELDVNHRLITSCLYCKYRKIQMYRK